MVKKKTNLEGARAKRKASEQNRRDRTKNDPVLYEEFKRKERERYHKRKQMGQIKTIADLTEREKRARRKRWVEKTRKSRQKRKAAEELGNAIISPPMSDVELQEVHPVPREACVGRAGSSREMSGKKVAKRNKSKAYREIKRLKMELDKSKNESYKMKKSKEKYKKRFMRLKELTKNTKSPQQKIKSILRGEKVSPRVRKALEFGVALTTQIEENYKKNEHSRKAKKAFALVLAGKVVKKYRSMHKLPLESYKKHLKKINHDSKLIDTLTQTITYKTKNRIKVKGDVLKFFEQDDVSRLEPGIKDCITKNKVRKQKRTLMGDLINLHKKFEVEFGYNVPYSTFCSFRPFWVLKPSVSKRDTCACEKHENMNLVFEKLKRLKVITGFCDLDSLIKSLCCSDEALTKEECWERTCLKCCDKSFQIQEFENDKTFVDQWSKKEVKFTVKGKEKSTKKVVKEKIELYIRDLVNKFQGMLPGFIKHICNIVHQYRSIKNLKQTLKPDEILVHVDFSQNYECKYSKEIQSMHFGGSRDQVTMHTGVMYFRTAEANNELKVLSFCSLSESLRHDASAICAHLNKVLFLAHRKIEKINAIHFLSDSPTTQYRNKTLFSLIQKHFSQFCNSITWNYSECGHGKGAPDGIGGTLKRTANKLVAEGTDIPTFQVLLDCLKEKFKDTIKLFHVTTAEINEVDDLVEKKVTPFIGTMKVHQVFWTNSDMNNLQMRRLSCFECKSKDNCKHYHLRNYNPKCPDQTKTYKNSKAMKMNPGVLQEDQTALSRVRYSDIYSSDSDESDELDVGSWVGVVYDTKWYPGIVETKEDKIKVSFMARARAGQKFFWPSPPDVQMLDPAHIMCRITKPPHPVSNRHFGFEDITKYDEIFNKMLKTT